MQGALYKQPALGELVKVKAVSHGDRAVTVDQQKRRKPGKHVCLSLVRLVKVEAVTHFAHLGSHCRPRKVT
eukprot:1139136-Pelagomonas_calceolata.AAC.5